MQQFSRVCMIADHDQRQIEYVCTYPECNQSRFACSQCVKIFNHKHQQQDQSHVLDNKQLYEEIQERIKKRQSGVKLMAKGLQGIIYEVQNLFQNIRNMIEQMEQFIDYNHNDQQLNELLLKLRINGFNQLDEVQLKILMNINQQVGDINTQLLKQSNILIQNAKRIQEWCYSQQQYQRLYQKMKDSKYEVITYDQVEGDSKIYSSAISNDLKYIVSGGSEKKLNIWNYSNKTLIKSIYFDNIIFKIKFTDDSKFLYVGKDYVLYQFDVNNNFKETYKQSIHQNIIYNIFCITNTIILTCSSDKTIIKTDVNLKQQLLLIKANDSYIYGLDYNQNLDMIASSSFDTSIKIWNGNNGQLVLEKQNAHKNNLIYQVLFIIKGKQLISLDSPGKILVWKINYENRQLEQKYQISDTKEVFNISLVLNQQYITLVCRGIIKIYSIKGDYIKQFNHDVKEFWPYNTIQPQSMKAIAIQGARILKICKVELDLN